MPAHLDSVNQPATCLVFNPKKVCGVTTLDVCRANTFVGANQGVDPSTLDVPVIGGHAGITILPLLSQTGLTFSEADREALTKRIQFGGDEVVQAKAGAGSATLSMAYAGYIFAENVLKAKRGEVSQGIQATRRTPGPGSEQRALLPCP
jgi:malate dehydrogenase